MRREGGPFLRMKLVWEGRDWRTKKVNLSYNIYVLSNYTHTVTKHKSVCRKISTHIVTIHIPYSLDTYIYIHTYIHHAHYVHTMHTHALLSARPQE